MGNVTTLRPARGVTPGAAVAAYLATIPGSKAATRRAYGLVLGRFVTRFADVADVSEIGPDELAEWFTGQWGERSAQRWNACRAALQSAYAYWEDQGWVPDGRAPLARLRRRKTAPDRDRALSRDQVGQLLTSDRHPLRDRLLWRMAYETAARSAELLGLDVGDLDMPNRSARVRRKGGAMDVIVWQTGTARMLPRYLRGRADGPLFVTERKARVVLPPGDLDSHGRARLSYAQAEDIFK